MNRAIAASMVMLSALLGCGGGADRKAGAVADGIDGRVEDLVTIRKGLYGQVTSVDDVGEPQPEYLPGFGIDVFPVPDGTELGSPIAHAASVSRGFYEIELSPSEYVVCSSFRRCVRLALGDELHRLDYEFSVGPGWSAGTSWP